MAATYTAQWFKSRMKIVMSDFDPDATAATIVDLDPATSGEGLPIETYRRFCAALFRSVGTGAVSEFAIVAGTDADLTGATVVVTHALGSDPDAVGDQIFLECDVEQVHEVLATATHIGVRVSMATATDECVILFIAGDPVYPVSGLTADYIAA